MIHIDPETRQRVLVQPHSGDFTYDADIVAGGSTLAMETVPLLGPWSDFTGSSFLTGNEEAIDNHGLDLYQTVGSRSGEGGMLIQPNKDLTLTTVIRNGSCTATKAYVREPDGTFIGSNTFVDGLATFDLPLSAGSAYIVDADLNGLLYVGTVNTNVSLPVNKTNVSFVSGVEDGSSPFYYSNRGFNISGVITTSTFEYESAPTTKQQMYAGGAENEFDGSDERYTDDANLDRLNIVGQSASTTRRRQKKKYYANN